MKLTPSVEEFLAWPKSKSWGQAVYSRTDQMGKNGCDIASDNKS